ncbi:MAG: hypothetical protein LBQ66_00020 [Planctomycetaceae bacterium]|nr:hypothetical protein [Planctomycetaceae bacterium]
MGVLVYQYVIRPRCRRVRRRNRPAVGYPPYVDNVCSDPFWLLPFQGERVIGGDFHRALPCAMGFLPRWGVLVLPMRNLPPLSAGTPT